MAHVWIIEIMRNGKYEPCGGYAATYFQNKKTGIPELNKFRSGAPNHKFQIVRYERKKSGE